MPRSSFLHRLATISVLGPGVVLSRLCASETESPPFTRAVALQSCRRNCPPPPDLVLWRVLFACLFCSRCVFPPDIGIAVYLGLRNPSLPGCGSHPSCVITKPSTGYPSDKVTRIRRKDQSDRPESTTAVNLPKIEHIATDPFRRESALSTPVSRSENSRSENPQVRGIRGLPLSGRVAPL